jgi:hypothetical protein
MRKRAAAIFSRGFPNKLRDVPADPVKKRLSPLSHNWTIDSCSSERIMGDAEGKGGMAGSALLRVPSLGIGFSISSRCCEGPSISTSPIPTVCSSMLPSSLSDNSMEPRVGTAQQKRDESGRITSRHRPSSERAHRSEVLHSRRSSSMLLFCLEMFYIERCSFRREQPHTHARYHTPANLVFRVEHRRF